DARFLRLLKYLALIQEKTGVSFTIPEHTIRFQEANIIGGTANVLKTGHAQYTAQPWESISSVEQARNALESFDSGTPAPMALHFEDQHVIVFGRSIPLGPVTFFCSRAHITEEDREILRKNLGRAVAGSSISIRFTPFDDSPIEARYIKWLPEDEAAAIRKLPMYSTKKDVSAPDEWILPEMNAHGAIALLKSWYDEDAD